MCTPITLLKDGSVHTHPAYMPARIQAGIHKAVTKNTTSSLIIPILLACEAMRDKLVSRPTRKAQITRRGSLSAGQLPMHVV